MKDTSLERRSFKGLTTNNEERAANQPMVIKGYFSVFGQESKNLGGFKEIIEPGAFDKTLSEERDIFALAHHDWNQVMGRTKNGSLSLRTDDHGLYAEMTLPNTQAARDLYQSVQDGYIDSASFGFRILDKEIERRSTGELIQRVKEVELHEVSIVSNPAYAQTEVSARSIEKFKKDEEAKAKAEELRRHLVQKLELEMLIDEDVE